MTGGQLSAPFNHGQCILQGEELARRGLGVGSAQQELHSEMPQIGILGSATSTTRVNTTMFLGNLSQAPHVPIPAKRGCGK